MFAYVCDFERLDFELPEWALERMVIWTNRSIFSPSPQGLFHRTTGTAQEHLRLEEPEEYVEKTEKTTTKQ